MWYAEGLAKHHNDVDRNFYNASSINPITVPESPCLAEQPALCYMKGELTHMHP